MAILKRDFWEEETPVELVAQRESARQLRVLRETAVTHEQCSAHRRSVLRLRDMARAALVFSALSLAICVVLLAALLLRR